MTVLEVIQRSTEFLARKGVESPRLQVELLLAHVLKLPRLQLYLNFERVLAPGELELLRGLIRRRGEREPLQHLVGSTGFCGLQIAVSGDVLVPRPETELLAETGWQWLERRVAQGQSAPVALDFGTGSGCIAIALAVHVPSLVVYATDISEAALRMARLNAERHRVSDRIRFVGPEELDPDKAGPLRFDLIISNPPYIPTAEIDRLEPEVRDFDPRLALDGGVDGLAFYRQLAMESCRWVAPGGMVAVEFGDEQGPAVAEIFRDLEWVIEPLLKDLSGRARILIARRMEA